MTKSFSGGIIDYSEGKLESNQLSDVETDITPSVNQFISYNTGLSKVFLNWVLFDNQFN